MKSVLVVILSLLGAGSAYAYPSNSINDQTTSCIAIQNVSHTTPGLTRKFFGKAGLNSATKLVLNGSLDKSIFKFANISFDDDAESKDSSMVLSLEFDTISVYTKKEGKLTLARHGSSILKPGSDFTLEVTVVEMGPGWDVYAFFVHINGDFFYIFEEQPGLEILYANYISVFNDITVNSVELCIDNN